jgi:phosphodiesterase/alkaline phosphatase D-like protein
MNKNPMLIAGVIVLILVGGLLVYATQRAPGLASATATSTDAVAVGTDDPTVPAVTTSILVVASNATAVVTGKVAPNGSSTGYWYEYGSTSAFGMLTATQTIGSGYVNITAPAIITGLSPSTLYYYRLNARNAYGTSSGQSYSFTTNTNPPATGKAPTTSTGSSSAVSRVAATVTGAVTPNNSDTSYWFEYGETTDFGNTTLFHSAGAGGSPIQASVVLSSLKPLTKYYFRLNAQNQYGTVNGGTLNFTTSGPAVSGTASVMTTAVSNLGSSSATLRGHLNPNGAATTYWFEYSKDSLLGNLFGTSVSTELPASASTISVAADIQNLTPHTTYYYRLVANNSFGMVVGNVVVFKTQ